LFDEASESRATVAIWLHRLILVWPMSALGHKRTFAVQNGMSALPPKATWIAASAMSAVPEADIRPLFDYFI
jgi:hypothetical protein